MKIKTSKANTSLQKVNPLYMKTNMRDYHVKGPLGSGFYIDDFVFSPTQLSDLEFYLTAEDGLTLIDGDTDIDSWHDLSSNYFNGLSLTTFSQLRANYSATGLNGNPCVDFATSDFAFTSAWGAKLSKNVPFTMFGKIRIDSTASASQGILTCSPAADDRFQISITSNTQLNFAYYNGSAWAGMRHTIAAATDYWFVFQQHVGTITPRLWINGVEILTTSTTNAGIAANGIYIVGSIRDTTTGSQFDGKISRLGFTSAIESEATVEKINNYLSAA